MWEVPSAPLDYPLPLADEPVKDAKRGGFEKKILLTEVTTDD